VKCTDKLCNQGLFACLIAGSRTFNDAELLEKTMDRLLTNKQKVLIISGGARGADTLAENYAKKRGYKTLIMPAEWDKYGKSAGYKRNAKMHEALSYFEDRACVLFWDGKSKGTQHNIPLAKKYNTQIRIIRFDQLNT
jgi:hypothetical protein